MSSSSRLDYSPLDPFAGPPLSGGRVSVIYTPDGVSEDAEIYDENPVLVLVDTGGVARADERYLVAGIGDAMAQGYTVVELNPPGAL